MNKLYLLPISLFLLNPAFTEEIETNIVSSQFPIAFVEESPHQVYTEPRTEFTERAITDAIEIDPKVLEELNAEISLMLGKNDNDMVAFAEEGLISKKASQRSQTKFYEEEQESYFDDEYQEIAVEEDEYAEEELIMEAPRAPSRRSSIESDQRAEKKAPTNVKRYSTKPSQAPKTQNRTADSEYEESMQERRAPSAKRQADRSLNAPKAKQKVVESEYEESMQERRAPTTKRQSDRSLNAPKAKQRVVESQYEESVQERRAPATKRQSERSLNAPKAKQRVVESQYEESVQKQQAPKARGPKTPVATTPNVQKKAEEPQKRSQQNKARTSQPAPKQRPTNPAAQPSRQKSNTPNTRIHSPQTKRETPSQKQSSATRAPAKKAQAPARKNNTSAAAIAPQRKQEAAPRQQIAQNNSQMRNGSYQSMNDQDNQRKPKKIRYNTAVSPGTKNAYDVWLVGDALIWQAQEENLTYVYSGSVTPSQSTYDLPRLRFDWDWGFRIGGGVNTHRDGWDIGIYWTRIHNHSNGHVDSTSTKELFPVWGVSEQLFPGTISEARAHWQVHLNEIELNMGREFYAGRRLTLRPFAGVRTDWIKQKYNVDYTGTTSFLGTPLDQTAKLKNRFWGFGFVAGLNTDWLLSCGFSIYGNADIAFLMGFFDVDQKGTQNGSPLWSVDKGFRTGKPILDLGMGFKWSHLFYKDRFGLVFKAGYEYHDYFNQNQFLLSNGSEDFELFNPHGGDLTYQGAIISLQIDF